MASTTQVAQQLQLGRERNLSGFMEAKSGLQVACTARKGAWHLLQLHTCLLAAQRPDLAGSQADRQGRQPGCCTGSQVSTGGQRLHPPAPLSRGRWRPC